MYTSAVGNSDMSPCTQQTVTVPSVHESLGTYSACTKVRAQPVSTRAVTGLPFNKTETVGSLFTLGAIVGVGI